MDIIKVKIPVVGKDHLVKKKFLANPSGEKGVGCADGCIKIVLDDNMMDQIRSFKAMIHDKRSFEHSRKYGVNEENTTRLDEIPTDIIPGRTDPYLIVEEPGVFFWVGGVDPTKLWTPETNDEGQYEETTMMDGTIVYKLKKHLGKTVPLDSNSELNAYVVSNSTVDEGKPLYPAVHSPKSSMEHQYRYSSRSKKAGKSKRRRTRRLKKKRKKKQTKKRKKKRRTKKRYKRRKKKSVRKRGKKKN